MSSSSAIRSSPADPIAVPWPRVENFVGQIVHDVRNGLNALELQLSYLGEISTDPEAAEEVKRLRGSLMDINRQLQAVKLATASVTPHSLAYPAADFFEDLRERLARTHPQAAPHVTWEMTLDRDAALLTDPDLTINGLLELFANSFHFKGTNVHCRASSSSEQIRFTLEETPAAAPALAPSTWGCEPFVTTRRNSYGLGLFRVRRIIESQGGSFSVEYLPDDNRLLTTVILPTPPLEASIS